MKPHKLSSLVGSDFIPYRYSNTWNIEKTTGPDRLVIGPSAKQIDLMIQLATILPEPFGILYVLLISRKGNPSARYQCPYPCGRIEMESFLRKFQEFFQADGRHHLWVMSLPASSTLVYDQHDLIYAYGPLKQFGRILSKRGLEKDAVRFPVPHRHNYNPEYDEEEQRLLEHWNWRQSPLMEGDDL